MSRRNVEGLKITNSNLSDWDLGFRDFNKCDFTNLDIYGKELTRTKFINCNFTGARFVRNVWKDVNFENCNFQFSLFRENVLAYSLFQGCWLENTIFADTHIYCNSVNTQMLANYNLRGLREQIVVWKDRAGQVKVNYGSVTKSLDEMLEFVKGDMRYLTKEEREVFIIHLEMINFVY